jgi:hypothetical protein
MADIVSNLVAWFKCDEGSGTTTTDAINGIVGTLTAGPTWSSPGKIGAACLTFSGTSYVDCGNPSQLPTGTTARTLACWVKGASLAAGYTMAVAFGTGTTNNAMTIGRESSVWVTTTWAFEVNGGTADIGTWHHLCATYDGTTWLLYVDGVSVGTPLSGARSLTQGHLYIGCQLGPSEGFIGSVDDVRIYSRALSQADVTALVAYTGAGIGPAQKREGARHRSASMGYGIY